MRTLLSFILINLKTPFADAFLIPPISPTSGQTGARTVKRLGKITCNNVQLLPFFTKDRILDLSLVSNQDISESSTWILLPQTAQIKIDYDGAGNQHTQCFRNIRDEQEITDLIVQIQSVSSSILSIRRQHQKYFSKQKKKNRKAISKCRELVQILKEQSMYSSEPFSSLSDEKNTSEVDESVIALLRDALSRATVQALRAAADANDYVLIVQIVDVSIEFASSFRNDHNIQKSNNSNDDENHCHNTSYSILQPRLFGEAIQTLTRTTAGYSKIRQIWQKFKKSIHSGKCPYPDQATELNAMIIALHSRKRIRAALNLYHGNKHLIRADSFTATALFELLLDSIDYDIKFTLKSELHNNDCWQMKEAMEILEDFETRYRTDHSHGNDILNNQVYSMILKINDLVIRRSTEIGLTYDGGTFAMSILGRMKGLFISPDVITCTSIMSTLAKNNQWREAYSLLTAMQQSNKSFSTSSKIDAETDWILPRPNVYTYSSAISACARDNQMDIALEIFNMLKNEENHCHAERLENNDLYCTERNTWVYNAVLASCCSGNIKGYETALSLLQNMQDDADFKGLDTKPNTVTYNSILATLIGGEIGREVVKSGNFDEFNCNEVLFSQLDQDKIRPWESDINAEEQIVVDILSTMKEQKIPRDTITYHNAILACGNNSPDPAIRILSKAFNDDESISLDSSSGFSSIVNTAISVCVSHGSINQMMEIYGKYFTNQINPDATTYHLILKGACRSKHGESAYHFLQALCGNEESAYIFSDLYDINIVQRSHILEERHYFAVVDDCIRNDKIKHAMEVLNLMKNHGKFSPSLSSLTSIIISCSKKSIEIASKEYKKSRKRRKGQNVNHGKINRSSSQNRSKAALNLLRSLNSSYIPPAALSSVAKACAATGLWIDAYSLLHKIHSLSLDELTHSENLPLKTFPNKNGKKKVVSNLQSLPKLHRYVLNVCATYGDISNALRTVDMIESFNKDFINSGSDTEETEEIAPILSSILLSGESEGIVLPPMNRTITWGSNKRVHRFTGMDGNNWKLLIIAASKAGNWKVCLSTLQVLRSYIEELHPKHNEIVDIETSQSLQKKYENLSHALSSAIFCFESCKQYAWAIRVVDDWIKWSGRRPPKDAIIATCRVLASRGRGDQVKEIVSKVMRVPPTMIISAKFANQTLNTIDMIDYELSIYSFAINALYKNGLYDIADEIYLEGVSRNVLLWPVTENDHDTISIENMSQEQYELHQTSPLQLDLHGMTLAIAHSAVRTSLQKEVQQISLKADVSLLDDHEWGKNVMIITGKGLNSAERFRPILRPEVQRMLTEEFYPPLSTTSLPNNMGALQIPAKDVDEWLRHQRQQRGAYMLTVADLLKSVTGVSKLKNTILKIGKNESKDDL